MENQSDFDKYLSLKEHVKKLESQLLHRIVHRARIARSCDTCGEYISRHQAQTRDGRWHHLSCLCIVKNPTYGPERVEKMKNAEYLRAEKIFKRAANQRQDKVTEK